MTPSNDASSFRSPAMYDSAASIRLPKRGESPTGMGRSTTLPSRRSNSSLHSLYASTIRSSTSIPSSGSATPTASVIPGSVFSPGRQNGTQSPMNAPVGGSDELRSLILRGFAPHVAVHTSKDVDDIMHEKGFSGGFLELLRPFGESIPGKVAMIDSVRVTRAWGDFAIRFVAPTDGFKSQAVPGRSSLEGTNGTRESGRPSSHTIRTGGDLGQIEEVVERHLQYSEEYSNSPVEDYLNHKTASQPAETSESPFYTLFLKRTLSGIPLVPFETFSHPVSCVLAISSRHPSPIEELRRLYSSTSGGDYRLPQWVHQDYLRYYVLIHDDEEGDIAKSNTLFEQMKRHFGLHCHLLRLKPNRCIPSDDDSVEHPKCEWISAAEELAKIEKRETTDDIEDPTPYLYDSDVTALRTFTRELVVQSIIPHMERMAAQWNEHIASRRRGISGRFMSLSKRAWTPFSSSRTSSSPTASSSSSNYDSLQGFYRPEAPEALMRKLADFSFMLRDFKLALSTYTLLITDFNNDQAMLHYAAANEMAALSALMSTQPISSKTRTENIDNWLETALYNYNTRSSSPYHALRSTALGLELLRLRGSSAADDAARWGQRIIDANAKLVGGVGTALFQERISACYAARRGVGSMQLGSRRRKAGMWAALAADEWIKLEKPMQAEKNLDRAKAFYASRRPLITTANMDKEGEKEAIPLMPLKGMQEFLDAVYNDIVYLKFKYHRHDGEELESEVGEAAVVEEVSETLDIAPRSHRKSLIGGVVPAVQMDAGPLSPIRAKGEEVGFKDDNFE
ncbi:uncharacterized protein BDZ99DRAFT_456143 [Mytilinidion resinicola]|uniref:TRAPP complex protein TRS85 n=1 Tax=Mytilinidion resinicola TaxID=574789 RepID=A0A6A6Y1C3_9PEZI|nr:uncharacterized protein BDZ99DRAFT_456143 [Mytilinidion resinicola]KAF2801617.1 hypothetical protein BDZ99DRAFT_456143 [Mytilinidion resinicola]